MREDEVAVNPAGRRSKLKVVIAVIIALAILAAISAILLVGRKDDPKSSSILPSSILNQIAGEFTPYAYPASPPLDYKIDLKNVSYDEGVLFIPLQAPEGGQNFVITEQAMPEDFANTENLVGDETIRGADGKAVLSHRDGRTIATMVSGDKKTLIILTGDSGSSTTIIGDLIRALKPVRKNP